MSDKAILRADEVADRWQVSRRTVYRMYNAKKLPGFRLRGSIRFKIGDVLEFEARADAVADPMTVSQAAGILGVSTRQIYRFIVAEKLIVTAEDGETLIFRDGVDRLLRAREDRG